MAESETLLGEGYSVHSTARLTNVYKETVARPVASPRS